MSITLKALLQLGPEPLALYGLYRLGLATGHYRRAERVQKARSREFTTLQPLFPLPSRQELLRTLGKDGLGVLLSEADEVIKGKVRPFGGDPVPLRLCFEGPLRHWSDYVTGRAPLPLVQSACLTVARAQSTKPQDTDPKFIWEPARFGWAFTLVRAYYTTQKEKYAEAFWGYFGQFADGNPAYLGPHWMNGQEVAIRLMALIWAGQVLQDAAVSTPQRRARLTQSIAEHAARLPLTLIYARSQNNNHLIVESAALFAAGLALDHAPWRDLGWRWLNQALQHQISSYGEYIQHSTNYHRLMLQAALWVDVILRGQGRRWPWVSSDSLARASHWLFSMLDPVTGHAPNLGANDGSLILPLTSTAHDDYRPTVQAAARAFLRTSLPAGRWDELSLWLGLQAARHTAGSQAYIGDQLRGRESWAYLRASQFKSRLSHMDQLHFDLWWRGLNVAQDAGTYLYNAPPPWDNPLVSSRVHNTVTVDGRDQMTRGGRFLVLDWFPAYSKNLLEVDDQVLGRIVAYHRGYRRLGVLHERRGSVYRDGHWEVQDAMVFSRPGQHLLRLHWLLPDWEWKVKDDERQTHLRLRSPRGWVTLTVQLEPPSVGRRLDVSLVRAGQVAYGRRTALPFEGWISPTYGVKVPALSLAVAVESSTSLTFISEFTFPGRSPRHT